MSIQRKDVPAFASNQGDKTFCIGCNQNTNECRCVWAAIRELQTKVKAHENNEVTCQAEIKRLHDKFKMACRDYNALISESDLKIEKYNDATNRRVSAAVEGYSQLKQDIEHINAWINAEISSRSKSPVELASILPSIGELNKKVQEELKKAKAVRLPTGAFAIDIYPYQAEIMKRHAKIAENFKTIADLKPNHEELTKGEEWMAKNAVNISYDEWPQIEAFLKEKTKVKINHLESCLREKNARLKELQSEHQVLQTTSGAKSKKLDAALNDLNMAIMNDRKNREENHRLNEVIGNLTAQLEMIGKDRKRSEIFFKKLQAMEALTGVRDEYKTTWDVPHED